MSPSMGSSTGSRSSHPTGHCFTNGAGTATQLGQFQRPQNLAIDEHDHLWVADACNHRIQVFDATGDEPQLIRHWGSEGREPGQMRYPYDLVLMARDTFTSPSSATTACRNLRLDGTFVGSWGIQGREPGQLNSPWAMVRDSKQRLHILDTYNHRVQRTRM